MHAQLNRRGGLVTASASSMAGFILASSGYGPVLQGCRPSAGVTGLQVMSQMNFEYNAYGFVTKALSNDTTNLGSYEVLRATKPQPNPKPNPNCDANCDPNRDLNPHGTINANTNPNANPNTKKQSLTLTLTSHSAPVGLL